jgi:hypothetical protein
VACSQEVAEAARPERGDRVGRRAFLLGSVGSMAPPSVITSSFMWMPSSPSSAWRPIASVTEAPTSPPWAT